MRVLALLAIGIVSACSCTTSGAKPGNSSVLSDPYAACENASRVGCPFGKNSQCDSVLGVAVAEGHTTAKAIACVEAASNAPQIVACDPSYFVCGGDL